MVSASSFSPPHMLPIATSRVFLKPAEGPPRRQESLVGRSGLPRILPQRRLQESGNKSTRSEEHTSELQSQSNLVCRLLLEKKTHEPLVHCWHAQPARAEQCTCSAEHVTHRPGAHPIPSTLRENTETTTLCELAPPQRSLVA